MFKRQIISSLKDWKESVPHKPLVLRGARQVGKTTLVEQFSSEFENYLYFNLELISDRTLLESDIPLFQLLPLLFAQKNKSRIQGDTLIFIDEIQNSPRVVAKLRYFYEELPDLYLIAAGSLLENVVDIHASFPVGRVNYLPVRPCSFCEFLSATGHDGLFDFFKTPAYTVPLHKEIMGLFNQYCLVGGMPEVVQDFSENQDFVSIDKIFSRLVRGYMDDVEKYASSKTITEAVRFLIQYGWTYAGGTVKLTGFAGSDYRAREMGEAFRLLQKAMLVELVYPSTSCRLPSIPELKRMPKMFWMDTGIVNYVAKVRSEIIAAGDILDVWKGRIGEQVAAQELLTLSTDINQTRSFWTKGRGEQGAEVDLTWVVDSQLIPIEVKTGQNSHLRSLHSFMENAPTGIAVRIWSGPYSVDDVRVIGSGRVFRLVNLPFYLIGELENIIRKL